MKLLVADKFEQSGLDGLKAAGCDVVYEPDTVVYSGTHDNDTARGWYDSLAEHERDNFWRYLQRPPGAPHEAVWELMRLASSTVAALAITPFQDLLGLGSEARMNTPGSSVGAWKWRLDRMPGKDHGRRLRAATEAADRL